MNVRYRALTALLAALILATAAGAAVVETFAEGQALARETGKPLILDFGAKW